MKPRDTVILPARVRITIADQVKAQANHEGLSVSRWINEAIIARLKVK